MRQTAQRINTWAMSLRLQMHGLIRTENYSLSGDISKYMQLQPDDLITWPKNLNNVCSRAIR